MARDAHTTQATNQTGGGFVTTDPTPGLLRAWGPRGATPLDRVRITDKGLTLGRGSDADWTVEDRRLSKIHARFVLRNGALEVTDAGSTNGTFVNGEPAGPTPRSLSPGDLVRLGSCLLVADADIANQDETAGDPGAGVGLVGRFHAARIVARIRRLATIGGHVLIHGESGVGKELAARLFAQETRRLEQTSGELVAHNCARFATADEATATLLGVQAGVFTGVKPRRGLLERAQGGVLFLDEVHALPMRVQQSLLRFAEDGGFARVGEVEVRSLPVRLLLGTNLGLASAQSQGFIATDLVSRLQALEIPPLGSRRADIPEIFSHVLRDALARQGIAAERLAGALHPDQLEAICLLPFRNRNVRELIQLADLFVASVALEEHPPRQALGALLAERYPDNPVVKRMVSRPDREPERGRGWSHYERHRQAIIDAYRASGHNLSATERTLKSQGIKASRRWLRDYLKRWGER